MRIFAERGRVIVALRAGRCILSPRQALDASTALLTAADEANGYGQAVRGEIPDPDPRTNPVRKPRGRRR